MKLTFYIVFTSNIRFTLRSDICHFFSFWWLLAVSCNGIWFGQGAPKELFFFLFQSLWQTYSWVGRPVLLQWYTSLQRLWKLSLTHYEMAAWTPVLNQRLWPTTISEYWFLFPTHFMESGFSLEEFRLVVLYMGWPYMVSLAAMVKFPVNSECVPLINKWNGQMGCFVDSPVPGTTKDMP